jgi:hypothetical protein
MSWFTCTINSAGPAANATGFANGAVYINLTDQSGSFAKAWFYAAENSKGYMLAVALAAINLGAQVQMEADPPNQNNDPFTEISRFYINAS